MKVLLYLNLTCKPTISLTRFSKFAITKNANTLDNYKDFNKVVTRLRVKVRGGMRARSQRLRANNSN